MRKLIDPPLNAVGRKLAALGIRANAVTLAGLIIGLFAALMIALGQPLLALIPLLISRIADGLDGAVARATEKTDFGGYLDITADFLFYGAIPFAFVVMDPSANGLAGAFLITSFYFNGTSFLGYAILAEKNAMVTTAQGHKSLFVLLCLFPAAFVPMAWGFGAACFATGFLRIYGAYQVFNEMRGPSQPHKRPAKSNNAYGLVWSGQPARRGTRTASIGFKSGERKRTRSSASCTPVTTSPLICVCTAERE